jgi:hypothetical protein
MHAQSKPQNLTGQRTEATSSCHAQQPFCESELPPDSYEALVIGNSKSVNYLGILRLKGRPSLRDIGRKFAALSLLVALVMIGVSPLAEALGAADLPACCNGTFCPVHHRQASELQNDKKNCDGMGTSGSRDCSMRACDAAPNPVVGTAVFVLGSPLALHGPAMAEPAPLFATLTFSYAIPLPLTPPPRTLPS